MKLTKLPLIGLASIVGLSAFGGTAFAALEPGQAAKTNSNATVQFKEYSDPLNPDNGGPLRIDKVTDMTFGTQVISGDDQVYQATFKDEVDENGNKVSDYIRVIDDRGSNKGWELQVKNDGFKSTDGKLTLDGAELKITTVSATSKSNNQLPSSLNEVVINNNGFKSLTNAKANEGVGTTTLWFGESTNTADATNQGVTLSIPGRSTKVKDTTYQTTLTWLLLDDPSK